MDLYRGEVKNFLGSGCQYLYILERWKTYWCCKRFTQSSSSIIQKFTIWDITIAFEVCNSCKVAATGKNYQPSNSRKRIDWKIKRFSLKPFSIFCRNLNIEMHLFFLLWKTYRFPIVKSALRISIETNGFAWNSV